MQISQIAEIDKINEISNAIVAELQPEQIYLFGSFAKGTQTEDSDYDLCVIMPNDSKNPIDLEVKAYDALFNKFYAKEEIRDIDLIVNKKAIFDRLSKESSLQRDITKTGVCIYDSGR